jgi:hypothetical protein
MKRDDLQCRMSYALSKRKVAKDIRVNLYRQTEDDVNNLRLNEHKPPEMATAGRFGTSEEP